MRKWLEQPLIHKTAIDNRLACVECFADDPMISAELKETLGEIYDMERLMGRISYGTANARDLLALKNSLRSLPGIRMMLADLTAEGFAKLYEDLDPLEDICQLLEEAIDEEPPVSIREGGIIKSGYNEQVDKFRNAAVDGKSWLAELEAKEKEATGIKNLKVGYNRVFGYYIEVSKGQSHMAPDRFIRKQTLTNGERYITEELKEIEDTLLGAKEKGEALEYEIFCQIRDQVGSAMVRVQRTADAVAELDALRSLGEAAYRNHYVKPEILPPGKEIRIENGRHPVVEQMIPENTFIPNDTFLSQGRDRIAIITGPNMAGKSTYMRQVAVIVLMAQIGSFVPADMAHISIADRIFTRVGASDDLARGQSTFMVEMSEVSNILRHATEHSLLILDEIGRGTSTFDGLSIAWAVVEYISDKKIVGAKTLFATHYHELTQLEGQLSGVKNYCVAIKESGDDVIFLHKINPGSGDQSYGIEVAKLAGLPHWVLDRAHEILDELLDHDIAKRASSIVAKSSASDMEDADNEDQMSLFAPGAEGGEAANMATATVSSSQMAVMQELQEIDVNRLTPLEAMQLIYDWQEKVRSL